MNLKLDANDLSALTIAEKAAIVDSLFLMIAADRKIESGEAEVFNAAVHQIPWALDPTVIDMVLERARIRMKCTADRLQWQYWIKEVAMTLTSETIRVKVLGTMSQMALDSGKVDDAERGLLNTFAGAFALPMERLAEIRTQVVNDKLVK